MLDPVLAEIAWSGHLDPPGDIRGVPAREHRDGDSIRLLGAGIGAGIGARISAPADGDQPFQGGARCGQDRGRGRPDIGPACRRSR